MDLSFLETAATTSRHAVVLFGTGAGIAGYLAYHFSVKKNESKRSEFQLAAVILAILGIGATALNFNYTDEISSERDRLAKAKDVELERFKLEKDTEIKILGKENLTLRQHVGAVEKSNLKAAKEVATLQIEVADAKRRQSEAEIKLAEVRKRQEARTFDEDIFLSILATAPTGKIKIGYIQGVPEPATLASILRVALLKAKWNVLEFKPVVSVIERGYSPESEVFLMMRDLDNMSPSQQALQKALRKAGFHLQTTRDEKVPADISVLWIGPKL